MAKVMLSAQARRDLNEISNYISVHLKNKMAARHTLTIITAQLKTLEQFPESGTTILWGQSATIYRYLVCGSYLAFYHINENAAYVDRIIYGRRDYMALLFDDVLKTDSCDLSTE